MTYEYNPLCPCKQCTGKGLGWIQHLTPEQSYQRLDRLMKERAIRIYHNNQQFGFAMFSTGE
ncbi:hypothetical protein vBPpSSYP_217 [Pseudomonas phage vB_PpS_SYP]|nr:hypothetical protein vBPpSSYP_217 [Pseudomonas phage vB_PpS_SYP]